MLNKVSLPKVPPALRLAQFNWVSPPKSLFQPVSGRKLFAAIPVMLGVFTSPQMLSGSPATFEVVLYADNASKSMNAVGSCSNSVHCLSFPLLFEIMYFDWL